VDEKPQAMAYFPYTQGSGVPSTLQVELRTKDDAEALLPSVERVMHEMDPNIPLEKPMSQAAVFEDSYARQRLFSRLAMFFGLLAALLVGIGLYGTLSYRVSRRNTEIGVRMALGAQRGRVLRMVMRESLLIATLGVALGLSASSPAATRVDRGLGRHAGLVRGRPSRCSSRSSRSGGRFCYAG
jgi:predicted lysophospholipase L1 biosynthesis ABC-type transport system permease subunit